MSLSWNLYVIFVRYIKLSFSHWVRSHYIFVLSIIRVVWGNETVFVLPKIPSSSVGLSLIRHALRKAQFSSPRRVYLIELALHRYAPMKSRNLEKISWKDFSLSFPIEYILLWFLFLTCYPFLGDKKKLLAKTQVLNPVHKEAKIQNQKFCF